ncbi:MAG: group III truncated hemoglobin [Rhodoferax sp.]|nr:group III truncated hemoglobin [Rhodoferax sp.]
MDKASTPSDAVPAGPVIPNRELIIQLVHTFYADVRSDKVLGPTFDAVIEDRWSPHLARMVEFWSTVMLGTRSFKGNVFGKHMAIAGVTPEHFTRWLTYWFLRTSELCRPGAAAVLQKAALGIAKMLYRGYFGAAADFEEIVFEARKAARVRVNAASPISEIHP